MLISSTSAFLENESCVKIQKKCYKLIFAPKQENQQKNNNPPKTNKQNPQPQNPNKTNKTNPKTLSKAKPLPNGNLVTALVAVSIIATFS